jgi:hypothetical protein
MVMKKASDGDSPLRQGAGKSFWTLLISRQRRRWLAVYFVEIDRDFRFFPSRGIYRQKGSIRKWTRGLTPWWRSQGLARAAQGCVQVLVPLRLCFGLRLVFWKNRRFGFCFVQFREYFLCSFSKTQK